MNAPHHHVPADPLTDMLAHTLDQHTEALPPASRGLVVAFVIALHLLAIDLEPVPTAEVTDERALVLDEDLRVLARDERIIDRDVALRASTEDGFPGREVELLQQQAEAISGHARVPSG